MRTKSTKFWWITGIAMGAVLLLLGAAATYSVYFAGKALPGATVLGQSITGQTREQVAADLEKKVSDTVVTIQIEESEHTATLKELGFTVDTTQMVDSAFANNASVVSRFGALFQRQEVLPIFTQDETVTATYAEELTKSTGQVAADARVELSANSDSYIVIPAVSGKLADTQQLTATGSAAASQLSSGSLTIDLADVEPKVSTEAAQSIADAANKIVDVPIVVNGGAGESFSPTAQDRISWMKIDSADGKLSEPVLDKAAVTAWVETVAAQTNDEPQPGIHNVNSRGDTVSTPDPGASGWIVNNVAAITDGVVTALDNAQAYTGELNYDQVANEKWTDHLIADGAGGMAYEAAPGEKWIDINLSNYTVSAYEGATIVRGPVAIVSGAPGTPTVTGTYKVYLKLASQTMRGYNLDGTKYETPDVPWILYFTEDYALHGAYWRSSFGYGGAGGSHGCVNMPVSEAAWLYDWAAVGTVTVSHY